MFRNISLQKLTTFVSIHIQWGGGSGEAQWCLQHRWGGEIRDFNGLVVCVCVWGCGVLVSCPSAYRLLWQLKKALPAVRLSVTDLRSLCSKITAQPSTAVLMHMKQNGWTVQTHSVHGCTCTHACTDRKVSAEGSDGDVSLHTCDSHVLRT